MPLNVANYWELENIFMESISVFVDQVFDFWLSISMMYDGKETVFTDTVAYFYCVCLFC